MVFHLYLENSNSYYRNFTRIIEGEEWLNLSQDKIIEIISDNDVEVQKEELVYNAVALWLHHSYSSRKSVFHKVFLRLLVDYFNLVYLNSIQKDQSMGAEHIHHLFKRPS